MNLTELYDIGQILRIVNVKTLRTYNLGRVNPLGTFKISNIYSDVVEPSTDEDNFDAFRFGNIFLNDEFENEIVIEYEADIFLSEDETKIHDFITRTVRNSFGQNTRLDFSERTTFNSSIRIVY